MNKLLRYAAILKVVFSLSLIAGVGDIYKWPREVLPQRTEARVESQDREIRLLLFMSHNCSGCKAVDRMLDDRGFISANWSKGFTRDNIIQFVDTKKWPEASAKFNAHTLPCFVLVKDGQEIGRVDPDTEGWNPAEFIRLGTELYNQQFPEPPKQVSNAYTRGEIVVESISIPHTLMYEMATRTPPPLLVPLPSQSVRAVRATPERRGYPLRSNWWTGCPNWKHMTTGEHRGQFPAWWLKSLNYAELQSAHSDAHEGRVKWEYVPSR